MASPPQPCATAELPRGPPSTTTNGRRVHFIDDHTPSSLSLRLKFGPRHRPSMVLKISVYFEPGKMPRVKVRTKKPRDRRQRDYVEVTEEK
ncbi:hypothetical protein NU195Hw_Modified_308t1 [Hortaea werneckii]